MVITQAQPSISQLNRFIAKVREYPVSVKELIEYARQAGAPVSVVSFYDRFDPDRIFTSRQDLSASSEQVEIMREEESEQPREEETAAEDY